MNIADKTFSAKALHDFVMTYPEGCDAQKRAFLEKFGVFGNKYRFIGRWANNSDFTSHYVGPNTMGGKAARIITDIAPEAIVVTMTSGHHIDFTSSILLEEGVFSHTAENGAILFGYIKKVN